MVIKMTYLNKTFKTYMELELRERIAQEIESELEGLYPPVDDTEYAIISAVEHAIKIVRGQKWNIRKMILQLLIMQLIIYFYDF